MSTLQSTIARIRANGPFVRLLGKQIRKANITFVRSRKLRRLAEAVFNARSAVKNGMYLEAGVALGGTAVLIAKLKPRAAPLQLYDVFAMIPPPGENDSPDSVERYKVIASGKAEGLGGEEYYGYRKDIKETVVANLRKFSVEPERDKVTLIEGLFEDTLFPEGTVAFAHIDCDWYDPVVTCIDRIWPKLAPGGTMVFDDYRSYEGCRKAVDQFVARTPECEVIFSDVSFGVRKRR